MSASPVELGVDECVLNNSAENNDNDGPRHADDVDDGEQIISFFFTPIVKPRVSHREHCYYFG